MAVTRSPLLPPSKKQPLVTPEPKLVHRDYLRVEEEYPAVPMQEPRVSSLEPIPLDDEEKMDYEHNDIETYLIEPNEADFNDDVGGSSYMLAMGKAIPMSFHVDGHFEPVIDFDGASGVLEPTSAIDMTEAPTLAPLLLVRWKLIVHGSSDDDDDASVSLMLIAVGRVA
ncbi:uncharacterized protein A4U43_C09F10150 [Asparagus officinalis]|uniref:Uncharacterized protein n=1 Tax=Asparagus officinalis TaxID=4686 RepID=A0A5P1E6S3_ASPOF|nr:uncharacterized protein A4U43_C09F10150 [Asparagus officinalis]